MLLALVGGCVSDGISALNYSVREVRQRTRQDAMDAAEVALVGLGFGVARRDLGEGLVESAPFEGRFSGEGPQTDSAGDRTRRVVQVRLEDFPTGIRVFCKVAVQSQSTQTYRLMSTDREGDDRPATTPIDREAATTSTQNSLWQTVRRDKAAERIVLEAVLQSLGVASDAENGTPR